MSLAVRSLSLATTALLAACTSDVLVESPPRVELDEGALQSCGTYVVAPRTSSLSSTEAGWTALAPPRRTVYINRRGGTYAPGNDDASTNRSSIPSRTSTIAAYEGTEAQWTQLVGCVREQYARYAVDITEVDPGAAPHIEAVLGGIASDLGLGSGVGGIAPMYGDCSVVERAVVYVFTRAFGSVQSECEIAAHEIGHALGLDHEYLCEDPMTYLSGCGAKTFQDVEARCGEYGARACMCGPTQDSVQHLLATLGPAGDPPPPPPPPTGDTTPPVVAVGAPADGATLPANAAIAITATATDDIGVARVELLWRQPSGDVTVDCAAPGTGVTCRFAGGTATWQFTVGTGARSLAVRATDLAGNVTTTPRRSITLGGAPPPANAAPTVALDAPAAGLVVRRGALVQVRATAADDRRVVQVRLAWSSPSGTTYYTLANLGGDTWGIDLALSSSAVAGARTLIVTATDEQGSATTTATRTIQVAP